jgi:hypothetical protein
MDATCSLNSHVISASFMDQVTSTIFVAKVIVIILVAQAVH